MLQDLMGAEAMGLGTSIKDITDERLCPYFLSGVCPHELFSNTVRFPHLETRRFGGVRLEQCCCCCRKPTWGRANARIPTP
jgi:hypothetical protein